MSKKINLAKYLLLREIFPANIRFFPRYIIVLPRKWKEIEWWLTGYNSS